MSQPYNIAVLIGSLREGSYSRKLAAVLQQNASENLHFTLIKIDDLPFYSEDLEMAGAPAPWRRLREQVAAADGALFITPEYNRSLPAALKNALDVGSRPLGENVWSGKPALAVSFSQGAMGGYGANQHLRQIMAVLNMPLMPQPEAYIGKVQELLTSADEKGNRRFLKRLMQAYEAWLTKQLR